MGFKIQVKKKKKISKKNQGRGDFRLFFIFIALTTWPSGKAGTANPFFPIQIRVSPDQQKTRNTLFCFVDILSPIEITEEKDSLYFQECCCLFCLRLIFPDSTSNHTRTSYN